MPSIDNKKKNQQNKTMYIFLATFFVSLIVIIYLAQAFTPDIDVDVNSETTVSDSDRPDIDSRLKELQQDELINASPKRDDAESSSEIIDQLKKFKEEAIEKQRKNDEAAEEEKQEQAAKAPNKPEAAGSTTKQPTATSKMAKVYVGRFATFEDAIKVQDALIQNSLVSSPFIKNLGSHYVIQVGSYANQQTAQNIAENLIDHGYSARMVFE